MKKALTLILVLTAVRAFACGGYGDLYPKWSIGVIGIGNFNMPVNGVRPYFMPGLQLTRTRALSGWTQRAAIEYTKYTKLPDEFPVGSADMMYSQGYEKRALLRAGVERGWFLHRLFRPYAAVDVAGHFSKSDMRFSGGIAGLDQREEQTTKGFGLMPAVGFKTFIGRRISIYAEYRAEAFLNDVDTQITDYRGFADYRPTSDTQFDLKAGKLFHAGIQVMF